MQIRYSSKYKVIAFLLVLAFLVSMVPQNVSAFSINKGTFKSLSNYPGIKKFNYAATPVRENFVTSDMVDSGYSFKVGSKAVDEYFGTTGLFDDKENNVTRKGFYLKKNTKGKCGVRYNKLFRYNNTWIDVKTTYTNWSIKSGYTPFVAGGFCSTWWSGGVNWVKEKHEFFVSGTDTRINVKGFFTFADVDDCQGMGIPTDQIDKVWTNSKSTILNYKKEDGVTLIKSDDVLIPNKSHSDYSPTKAATATFSYQFSGKTHTQYIIDGNADNSTNVINFEAAKYIPSKIPDPKPPEIAKTVSDDDESYETSNTVASVKDTWTYDVNGTVPVETESGNFYDGFRFTDTVDSCLEIKDVKVYKNRASNVSNDFTISQSGQTATAIAKSYKNEDFYGSYYQLRIKVGIKSGISKSTLASHGHLDAGQTKLTFTNTGKVIYKDGKGEYERATNKVTTTIPIAQLDITKSANKDEYMVGDMVDYTVLLKQTRTKAAATNVVVTDTSLPNGLTLKYDTLTVSGVSGCTKTQSGNGFKITVPRLNYGQTLKITYKARAMQAVAGKTVTNTVTATPDPPVPPEQDDSTVKILPYSISGTKTWDDNQNQDGFRPGKITVRLYADGEEVNSQEVSEGTGWKYKFDNLQRFKDNDEEIKYTIKEDAVAKYTTTYTGFDIANKHVPEQVTISGKKTWNDANDLDKVRPKRVIAYLMANGEIYRTKTLSADDNWAYSWTVDKYRHVGQLVKYTVKEKPVDLYDTYINGFNILNGHAPLAIDLTKYEKLEDGTKSTNPIKGAIYQAYKVGTTNADGAKDPDSYLGEFKTNDKGKLTVSGIQPGDYYLVEKEAPFGYKMDQQRINVTVGKVDTSKTITGVKTTNVTAYNQRLYGSISILKKDNSDNVVPDVEFRLYSDAACTKEVKKGTTDGYGTLKFSNLKWGTYYLKETDTPKGYQISNQVEKVVVDTAKLDYTYERYNDQKKGSVILTKTDETEKIKLKGAIYDLYKKNGTVYKENLVTDANGQLKVDNLIWGGYYFKEKTPPAGYGLSDDLIRFSVNSTTGGITQYVQAIDKAKMCEAKVTKKLKAGDVYYDHGVPSFMFKLSGTTIDGEKKTYHQIITFTEEYVKAHTDTNGYVQNSATFSGLKSGNYTLEEMEHQRYKLANIEALSSNATKAGEKVNLNLTGATDGAATFVNNKTDWGDYSDTTAAANLVKMYRKLTAIIVGYTGTEIIEGNSYFPKDKLNVTAVYDDGTERKLKPEEFTLKDANGKALSKVPRAAGEYTGTVSYTERGITRTGAFSYQVAAVKMVTVTFDTTGGIPLASQIVPKYSTLSELDKKKYTPTKSGYGFINWYTDKALTQKFSLDADITDSITLYAAWEEKHLNDYSWAEIKEIADSGMAESFFDECFQAVKADLADGVLTQATLDKHTKEFDYGSASAHAMIMGFNQDEKADGTKAGITFLTYETVGNGQMNSTNTNIGGWSSCAMRKETLNTDYNKLDEELKAVLAPVKKDTFSKDSASVISKLTTTDKLWLPSQSEIYGAWGYEGASLEKSIYFSDTDYGSLRGMKGEGAQYKLFKDLVPDGTVNAEKALNLGSEWWLRSPSFENTTNWCFINENGAAK